MSDVGKILDRWFETADPAKGYPQTIVRATWDELESLGFRRVREDHDEGLHCEGMFRVLVGSSMHGVRIRLQHRSPVISGRWVDLLAVDIPSVDHVEERVAEVAQRMTEYARSSAPIQSAGDAVRPAVPRRITL